LSTLVAFKKADDEKKKNVFAHSDAEWKNINAVAALLPAIHVDCSYEVADEKGLYEGDVVTLNVKLTRLRNLDQLTESETSSVSMEGGEEEDGEEGGDGEGAKANRRDRKKPKELKAAEDVKPASPTNGDAKKHDSALATTSTDASTPTTEAESKEIADRKARGDASRADFERKEASNAHLSEEQRIERLALSAPREKELDSEDAPVVHCPRYYLLHPLPHVVNIVAIVTDSLSVYVCDCVIQ
jgi:hypothetical protein